MLENAEYFNDTEEAKRVINIELNALERLSSGIGLEFINTVNAILNTTGRVILTGMGKSGHIANKISSTFASTGTTSHFVHPAEASHGDLGMITNKDLIIALSNSGDTKELYDILTYSKRNGIKIIGITSKANSTLARNSSIALILPKCEEACPLGLAPTTSTTMMLVLGDAIATTVLKRKGFSAQDFGSLHPGGKLGQQLLTVNSIMHKGSDMPVVFDNSSIQELLLEMSSKGYGCVCVIDRSKKLVGVVTDGDIRRNINGNILDTPITKIMNHRPATISPQTIAQEAIAIMNSKKITSLIVINDDTELVGILHIHDCLKTGLS